MNKRPGYPLATGNEVWSGEATRRGGFVVEEARVDINITGSGNANAFPDSQRKERPIWMVESTIASNETQVLNIYFIYYFYCIFT